MLGMLVPEEFKRLTRCFWQGSHREAKSREDFIAQAINLNTPEQQAVIKKFLTDLLEDQPSVEKLQQVWNSGGSSYGIYDEGIRDFLESIRDTIH